MTEDHPDWITRDKIKARTARRYADKLDVMSNFAEDMGEAELADTLFDAARAMYLMAADLDKE